MFLKTEETRYERAIESTLAEVAPSPDIFISRWLWGEFPPYSSITEEIYMFNFHEHVYPGGSYDKRNFDKFRT